MLLAGSSGGLGDSTQGAFEGNGAQVKTSTQGTENSPGHGRGHTADAGASHITKASPSPKPPPNPHWTVCTSGACTAREPAEVGAPPSPAPAADPPPPAEPGAPPTPGLTDVAHFLVGNPTAKSEPAGWTIAGAETNFIANAGESERAGELLGQPVTVHFTPVAYDWRYGDNSGRTTTTPGATWAASGLPDFSKTATSHAYASRGTYTVTVTVEYSARYQYAGQAWADIPGTLGLTSEPITVTVKGVKTVLVGKTCDENPSGPGC
ncbi:hypothetical protein GCM10022288_08600 [Gryllotalpicola kribbensis]|uniref:PKD domain-containing protein n=1 Tax=Gryllotalpicola kribbensis TaxID=993084 RepID=A0ABP8AM66_9MICO